MGAASISFNMKVQNVDHEQCLVVNNLSSYLNGTINCTKVQAEHLIFDNSELIKMSYYKYRISQEYRILEKQIQDLKLDRQNKYEFKNLLYVLLVFLSGLSIAYNYFIDKYYV